MAEFPRFGIAAFAGRPLQSREVRLEVPGSARNTLVLTAAELAGLPRTRFIADFHCAAGWSHRSLEWEGFRFRDVWETFSASHVHAAGDSLIVLRCQDGYRTSLPLGDLMAPEVLIADRLNGQPLTMEHGAPIRLIAPAHYGYKSAKHLCRVELWSGERQYRALLTFLDHPRARVMCEERARFLPGWLLRYLFRPFIRPLIRKVELAAARGQSQD